MAKRVKGHRLETVSNRGGIVAGCSCGKIYKPEGYGQSGRTVDLGIWVGPKEIRDPAIKESHRKHIESL